MLATFHLDINNSKKIVVLNYDYIKIKWDYTDGYLYQY